MRNIQPDMTRWARFATKHEHGTGDVFNYDAMSHWVEIEDAAHLVANEHHVSPVPIAMHPATRQAFHALGGPLSDGL